MELSTCATSVVGMWTNATPRKKAAAAKPATSPTTPPPTATISDFRSPPARQRERTICSTLRRFFSDSASSKRCTALRLEIRKLFCTAFPTALHTLGEETTFTLEKPPSLAISLEARLFVTATATTEKGPAEDLT